MKEKESGEKCDEEGLTYQIRTRINCESKK